MPLPGTAEDTGIDLTAIRIGAIGRHRDSVSRSLATSSAH